MSKKHFFSKSNLVLVSLVTAVVLVGLALSYTGNSSKIAVTEAAGGNIVTENVSAFGCDIGPVCGASCTGTFRQSVQGTGWSVDQGFRKLNITNNDSARPNIQTISIAVTRVDVDDDGYGDGWSKDTCRGGGAPFCSHTTGDNCAGTIYPNNEIWHASSADTRTHVSIDGTAINKLAPNGTSGIWGGFNAYYVVRTLVCGSGLIVGGINRDQCVQSQPSGSLPSADTELATNITSNSATLNGLVSSNGSPTSFFFEYGTTQALGNSTAPQLAGVVSGIRVSQSAFGLASNITYFYRAVAQNQFGFSHGAVMSFRTGSVVVTPTPVVTATPTVTPCISLPNIGCVPKITPTPVPTSTPRPTPTPTPIFTNTPTPTPTSTGTIGSVVCAPAFRAVEVGQPAVFQASGGSNSYQWFAQDGTPFTSVGSFFSTIYFTAGNGRLVRVFDTVTGNTATCVVNVSAISTVTPTPTISVTPTPTPALVPTPTPTPIFGSVPALFTVRATSISSSAAVLNGLVNPSGSPTWFYFEYGTSSVLGNTTSIQFAGSGQSWINVSHGLSGLNSNTVYFFRLVAQNQFGTSRGNVLSFATLTGTTFNSAPFVSTNSVSNIAQSTATLNGQVVPNASNNPARVWFQYGTDPNNFAFSTGLINVGTGISNTTFSQPILNLISGTTYYVRAVAQNDNGTSFGQTLSFVTQGPQIFGQAPFVETRTASFVSRNAAIINAGVNTNGFVTTAWFEFGATANLGQKTSLQTIGGNFATQTFTGTLSGLLPNKTYYYRVVAQNQFGTTNGAILSFKTSTVSATPTPTTTSTVTPSPVPAGEVDISCLTLVPSLSPASPNKGQEFTYSILYRNDCSADFPNVILKVTLPLEVTFKSANLPFSAEAGNNFSFTLGNLTKGFSSTLDIKGTVNDSANDGDTIIFSSVLNLTDSSGKPRSVVSTLSDTVGKGQVAGISADISNALGDGGWWWILFIVLIAVLIFLVYLLLSERKRRTQYSQNVRINTPPPAPPSFR